MKFRWTIKELEKVNDDESEMKSFIFAVLEERKSGLTNMYAPLYKTLQQAQQFIKDIKKLEEEKVDEITNQIMDEVRETFDLDSDTDIDDNLYGKVHNIISEIH